MRTELMFQSRHVNVREPDSLGRKNLTRRSRSIPRKLFLEGKPHLLPVYWLMMESALGREGIEHSGSYRFADHIYRNQPSGRNRLGQWIDALLLRMPAAQAFRRRYLNAQDAMGSALMRHVGTSPTMPFRVLAVPCGVPRDVVELAARLRVEHPEWLARIHYTGMDLDPQVLDIARNLLRNAGLGSIHLVRGDALDAAAYPRDSCQCALSTGLGEFLANDEILGFYRNVHAALGENGIFYTSATAVEPRSESLLRAFELRTHYRTAGELEALLASLPWRRLEITRDPTGLQTFAVAEK